MKNDYEIQQDVMNELKWHPFLKASEIGVAVKNGIVTLSGMVDSYAQKQEAEKAAKKVSGVRAIAEDIQIGVSPSFKKTDTEIAESVVSALKWHTAVPEEKIKVKVEHGTVTLEGSLDWEYQRSSAKNTVSGLLGVRNVINLITVNPKASEQDIIRKIKAAFHRSASIDAEKVEVDVTGNKVILKGNVRSITEKEDALDAAWCSPGVSVVENHIEVVPEPSLVF